MKLIVDTSIQTEKVGKMQEVEINGEPFFSIADVFKISNIVVDLNASSVVKKTRIKEFISEMSPHMSNRLYNVLTWSADELPYLEDITKKRFFRLINAGKKSYQEFLSVKEKYDELKNIP